MSLYVDELFSIDELEQTLKISATVVLFWTDERLALTSYPDCWNNNEPQTSACNESFTMRGELQERVNLNDR